MLSPATKVMILVWFSEMRMDPNCKEVVKKHLVPHVNDIKPSQYLLET